MQSGGGEPVGILPIPEGSSGKSRADGVARRDTKDSDRDASIRVSPGDTIAEASWVASESQASAEADEGRQPAVLETQTVREDHRF